MEPSISSTVHFVQQAHNMPAAISTHPLCAGPDEVPITLNDMELQLIHSGNFLAGCV